MNALEIYVLLVRDASTGEFTKRGVARNNFGDSRLSRKKVMEQFEGQRCAGAG